MAGKDKKPEIRFTGFTDAWEQRELGDEVVFYSGLTYSPSDVIESGGTLVLRSSNVKDGEIIDADNVYVSSQVVNSDNVQVGDVIVVVRNGSRSLIGKHAQIKETMNNTVIGAFMTGVRYQQAAFMNVLLSTPQFDSEIEKNMGATINQITTGAFKEMQFYFPDTDEQKRIGDFFRNLDNLITLHQRKCDKLVIVKKSMFEKMFPKDGANVPEIRFAGFTDAWEQRKLGEIADRVQGNDGRMDLPTLTISAANGWLDQRDRFYGNIAGNEQKNYTLLSKGELSYNHGNSKLAKYGTVFELRNYEEALVPRVYHSFRVKEDTVSSFVEYLFSTKLPDKELGKLISSGARMDGLLNISYDDFIGIAVNTPQKAEQAKIGAFFRKLDHLITLHQRELEKLKNIKKSMLEKMFV